MTDKSVLAQKKIAVVDNHDLIREGLFTILKNQGFCDVEKCSTAIDLLSKLESGHSYDFYIIDIDLPDLDGFTLVKRIRNHNSMAPIIVSTANDEMWSIKKLLACNVNAIIYKTGDGDEILTAISEILKGNNYYCSTVLKTIEAANNATVHPTPRELEVLYQIAQGKTSREIAAAMFVTDNTIEAHRKSLFNKLGAVNVADLIVKAIQKGYLKKNRL